MGPTSLLSVNSPPLATESSDSQEACKEVVKVISLYYFLSLFFFSFYFPRLFFNTTAPS